MSKHTITFEWAGDWMEVSMTCPHDPADTTRPCWPYNEQGEPEPAPQKFCNWREWLDGDGPELIAPMLIATVPIDGMWDGDSYRFSLASEPVTEGPEPEPLGLVCAWSWEADGAEHRVHDCELPEGHTWPHRCVCSARDPEPEYAHVGWYEPNEDDPHQNPFTPTDWYCEQDNDTRVPVYVKATWPEPVTEDRPCPEGETP
jgi:hypothetical protein